MTGEERERRWNEIAHAMHRLEIELRRGQQNAMSVASRARRYSPMSVGSVSLDHAMRLHRQITAMLHAMMQEDERTCTTT